MLGAYLGEYDSVRRKHQLDDLSSFRAPAKTHTQSQGGGVFLVAQAGRALSGAYRSSPLAFLRSVRTRVNGGKDGLYEGGFQSWRPAMGVE